MKESDILPMKWLHIPVALSLLTRLPLRLQDSCFEHSPQAHWAYPIVGLVLASLLSVLIGALFWLGLSPQIIALCAIAGAAIMTGAMHLDGLADTLDGFWGGYSPERRLEIMKDSHIGTYGVLGLVCAVLLQWTALSALAQRGELITALFVIMPLSRAAMLVPMSKLPHARASGLAHMSGRAATTAMWIAFGLSAGIAVVLYGGAGVICVLVTYGIAQGISALADRKIGGQTGDVLGATQQITAMAICCVLSVP